MSCWPFGLAAGPAYATLAAPETDLAVGDVVGHRVIDPATGAILDVQVGVVVEISTAVVEDGPEPAACVTWATGGTSGPIPTRLLEVG